MPRKTFAKENPLLNAKKNANKAKRQSLVPSGCKIPLNIKMKIKRMLGEGAYQISEVADAFGVTRSVVYDILTRDSILMEMYENNLQREVDKVENKMMKRAQFDDGMAGERAGEFLLKSLRRDQYSEEFSKKDLLKDLPKIIVPLQVSRSPAEDTIDV